MLKLKQFYALFHPYSSFFFLLSVRDYAAAYFRRKNAVG